MTHKLLRRHTLSRDFIFTFLARMGVTMAGAVAGIVMARVLGASEYGRFSFSYSIIVFALIVVKFGLDAAAVKFVAEYSSSKRFPLLFGFIKSGRTHLLRTSLAAAVMVLLYVYFISPASSTIALCALPSFLLLAQLHFDQGVLNGLQKAALSSVPEGFIRAASLTLLVLGLGFFFQLHAESAFLINGASLLIALLFARLWVKQRLDKFDAAAAPIEFENRRWLVSGSSYLFIACSHIILSQTDIFMLGFYTNSETVGFYTVAVQASSFLLFFSSVINPVITPRMASAYARGDRNAMFVDARLATNLTFALSLPITVIFLIFRTELLTLLFGPAYAAAAAAFSLLIVGQFVKVISSAIGFVMTMSEGEATASYVIAGSALLNVILNLLFIPQYGALGAAFATACSGFLWNAVLIVIVRRRFGIWLIPFVKHKSLK